MHGEQDRFTAKEGIHLKKICSLLLAGAAALSLAACAAHRPETTLLVSTPTPMPTRTAAPAETPVIVPPTTTPTVDPEVSAALAAAARTPLPEVLPDVTEQARSYLDALDYSESELIGQLLYDGYQDDDIEAALEELNPDWTAECIHAAHVYAQLYDPCTPEKMESVLRSDGYTPDDISAALETVYGASEAETAEDAEVLQ